MISSLAPASSSGKKGEEPFAQKLLGGEAQGFLCASHASRRYVAERLVNAPGAHR